MLEGFFVSQLRAKVILYKAEFNFIKKGGLSIVDFVKKVQTITSMLTSTSCIISEEYRVLALCNGLGGDYDYS